MDLQGQIEKLAFSTFINAMQLSPEDGTFRSVISIEADGETKPLLLMGMTHRSFGDGRCTAVLNPTQEILDTASPMVGYDKWSFAGKCDMVCYQWIITNGKPYVSGGYTYKARKPKPARCHIMKLPC